MAPATYLVRLFDRRTGLPMRRDGATVAIRTPHPHEAATDALRGRDASLWEVRIDRLETACRTVSSGAAR